MKVEMLLGRLRGHVLDKPQHEAEYLRDTGQARFWEAAVARPVETPEGPSLADMTNAELAELAEQRGITVEHADGGRVPRKVDYLNALS
jgi:hypothetical protein